MQQLSLWGKPILVFRTEFDLTQISVLKQDLKEVRRKQRDLWREGPPVREKGKCKGRGAGTVEGTAEASVRLEGGRGARE